MDTIRFGRQTRALRRRRQWRQEDLAKAAGVSRSAVARVEQGHADRLTVHALDRIAAGIGARLVCRLDWNGEALDRLLDADHAGLVESVIGMLGGAGWTAAPEVSFNIRGERGSIDILAWNPISGALLVVEVKSVVPDVQATLYILDRKARLAPSLAAERGWPVNSVSRLLVIGEDRTSRRRVDRHQATFGTAFPDRTVFVRQWISRPPAQTEPLRGLMFLSGDHEAVARHRIAGRRRRVERGHPTDS